MFSKTVTQVIIPLPRPVLSREERFMAQATRFGLEVAKVGALPILGQNLIKVKKKFRKGWDGRSVTPPITQELSISQLICFKCLTTMYLFFCSSVIHYVRREYNCKMEGRLFHQGNTDEENTGYVVFKIKIHVTAWEIRWG